MSFIRAMKNKVTVGATAKVNLPDLEVFNLPARVDSGAASCAVSASFIDIYEDEQGPKLAVILFDPDNQFYTGEKLIFDNFILRNVRNSFGSKQERPMIETEIVVNKISHTVLIGFSNRSKLTYDMLIGRNLLELGFIVDVTK